MCVFVSSIWWVVFFASRFPKHTYTDTHRDRLGFVRFRSLLRWRSLNSPKCRQFDAFTAALTHWAVSLIPLTAAKHTHTHSLSMRSFYAYNQIALSHYDGYENSLTSNQWSSKWTNKISFLYYSFFFLLLCLTTILVRSQWTLRWSIGTFIQKKTSFNWNKFGRNARQPQSLTWQKSADTPYTPSTGCGSPLR